MLSLQRNQSICNIVVVSGRNGTFFRYACRSYYHVRSAVTQYFCYRWDSYSLCKIMNTWNVYTVHMSPTPSGISALQRFECSNANEMTNGIMFDFYPGLPHMVLIVWFSRLMPFRVIIANGWRMPKKCYGWSWSLSSSFVCTIRSSPTKPSRPSAMCWVHCWEVTQARRMCGGEKGIKCTALRW